MPIYMGLGLGGGIGTIFRFWLSGAISRHVGKTFPLGTLVTYATGSFISEFLAALTGPDAHWLVGPTFSIFFMVGIYGGYTTVSSFGLQTLNVAR
jgi:fluoride exporter